MLEKNYECFLECDKEYEEAKVVYLERLLIPQLLTDREQGLEVQLSEENHLVLRATVHIRIKT